MGKVEDSIVTAEQLHEERQQIFSNNLLRKRNEFNEIMSKDIPPEITFSDRLEDPIIKLDEAVEELQKKRTHELQIALTNQDKDAGQKWIGKQQIKIGNEISSDINHIDESFIDEEVEPKKVRFNTVDADDFLSKLLKKNSLEEEKIPSETAEALPTLPSLQEVSEVPGEEKKLLEDNSNYIELKKKYFKLKDDYDIIVTDHKNLNKRVIELIDSHAREKKEIFVQEIDRLKNINTEMMKEMNNKLMIMINSHTKERKDELNELKNKQTDMLEEVNKKVIGVKEYLEEYKDEESKKIEQRENWEMAILSEITYQRNKDDILENIAENITTIDERHKTVMTILSRILVNSSVNFNSENESEYRELEIESPNSRSSSPASGSVGNANSSNL